MRTRILWISVALLLLMVAGLVSIWPVRSLWYDETVNAYFATQSWGSIWEWCTQIDNQVPLHFVLLKLWGSVAGTSEFALRAFSFECTLLTLGGVIALGRRIGQNIIVGWLAAIALALSQGFLYAAFEIRAYALALALMAWSSVFLWELVERDSEDIRRLFYLAAYLVLALALVYTHYTGFFVLCAHALYAVWQAWITPRQRKLVVYIGLGLFLGYLPWIIALAGRDVREGTAYAGQVTPRVALNTYLDFYAYGQNILPEASPPRYALSILVVFLAALLLWIVLRPQSYKGFTFAALTFVVPLGVLLLMVYAVQGKLSGRHGWPLWLSASLLFGLSLGALTRFKWLRWPVWSAALLIVWLPSTANLQPIYNSYLREAFTYLDTHSQPGDVLVLRDGTLFAAAEYYQTKLPWIGLPSQKLTDVNHFLFFPEAEKQLAELISQHQAQRVWVVAWQGHIMDPQDLTDGILESIGQPEPLPDAFGFGDVSVMLYKLRDNRPLGEFRQTVSEMHPIAQTPQNGPVYLGGYVLDKRTFHPGDVLVIHTWWQRGQTVLPNMRVSVRLYAPDAAPNEFYRGAVLDQPPVSATFGQENWAPDTPIFSRFVLWLPPNTPTGMMTLKMVLYDVPLPGTFEPVFVTIDEIEIVPH
ncbi:MAG TPA: glycosyltransferase family 39 protein [Aggregatilineaceae bacterium]|nr:glycosyltransferase family 39 protein [Aggregatilineaceae bacterium]